MLMLMLVDAYWCVCRLFLCCSMQALNVVLTHTTADFDTLAAAVGLAKLWQDERPDDGKKREQKNEQHKET